MMMIMTKHPESLSRRLTNKKFKMVSGARAHKEQTLQDKYLNNESLFAPSDWRL